MNLLYNILLFAHVISAVVATGPLFAILPLLSRMKKAPEAEALSYVDALQGVLRAVAHGGHYVVPTGLVLIHFSGWSWGSSWLIVTYIAMTLSLYFMATAFKPARIYAKSADFSKDTYIHMVKVATWKYIVLMGFFIWLMTSKPNFW